MRTLICVAVALLVVGCGASNSTSKSATKTSPTPSHAALITGALDACTLITAQEATTTMGVTMQAFGQTGGAPVCIYAGQLADGTSISVVVYGQLYPDTTTADNVSPEQMAAAFRSQFGISSSKSLTGIGDKAFEYTTTATNGGSANSGVVVFVFKANAILLVAVSPTTDDSKAQALARLAVGNLPKS